MVTARMVSLALAACVAGGCSSAPPRAARPTPTLVVLDPGAMPRVRLRYDASPGPAERIEMRVQVSVSTTFTNTALQEGQRITVLPTLAIVGAVQVMSRTPENEAEVAFTAESSRSLDDIVDPRMQQVVDAQTALKDARATFRLLPTGEVADLKTELPNASPRLRSMLSSIDATITEMFVRLPDEAIGVGATWRIESELTIGSGSWQKEATYTLRRLTPDQAVVDFAVTLRASAQNLLVEPTATTTLTSGEGSMSGQAIIPRRGLVTVAATQSTTSANLRVTRRRDRFTTTVRTDTRSSVMRASVTPAPPP